MQLARALPQSGVAAIADSLEIDRAFAVQPKKYRHIELRVSAARPRRFHAELAKRLSRIAPCCSVVKAEGMEATPSSVELLLELERLACHLRGGLGEKDTTDRALHATDASPPDLVVDLTDGPATGQRISTIRVLYDGEPGEVSLLGALIEGRAPLIQVVDATKSVVLTEGRPATDNAATMAEAFDFVLARTITLLVAALNGVRHSGRGVLRPATAPKAAQLIVGKGRALATSAIRRLYHLCCFAPHWRVLWRRVDDKDVWDNGSLGGRDWNVIRDPGTHFFADPFPYIHEGQAHVFVEDLDHRTNKGVISVIPLGDDGKAGEARPVLEEPWHLSYPFLMRAEGQIWMIPESSSQRCVALYRAERFPDRWVRECTLIDNIEASDATLVEHQGQYWMFAATRGGEGSWSDVLSIFIAPSIRGPWRAHPANPVLVSASAARPAGCIVKRSGALLRPVQDCDHGYGTGIGLARIERLDEGGFAQRVTKVLRSPPHWPGRRLHTLNRSGPIECIDGAAHSPRNRTVGKLLENWLGFTLSGSH